MLISIGKSPKAEALDLVDVLLECHERIRRFTSMARAVAERADLPADEAIEACARVERYFGEALPLHVCDEEQSVLPRLRGVEPELDRALATMAEQHASHEPKLDALERASAAVRAAPGDPRLRAALADAARELEREFDEHLALAESIVFPAIRRLLPVPAQAEIIAELRLRRSVA